MFFTQAIVIGTGTIANNCAKLLKSKGVSISLIESRAGQAEITKQFCQNNEIEYFCLAKEEITKWLSQINENALIVSASNRYLFPESVITNPNLIIINYHSSLLPDFPGRNAEAWAIYYGKSNGGITWHKVVEKVDAGDLVIQKEIPITHKTTSFMLLREYTKIAFAAFEEIVDDLLANDIRYYKQKQKDAVKLFYSWERPNNSICDFSWSGEIISRFLRAMDYGPLFLLGPIFINFEGQKYSCDKFKINLVEHKNEIINYISSENKIELVKDGFQFIFYNITNQK
ncbi:MAG: hypothetical protein MH472_10780 [Bacteroidia bacterium]|nr:hypothetical protein [Bacteroidia bacterium]